MFCMEYLIQNTSWLEECLGEVDDDYFIIDCPGQIEIYTHMDLMRRFVDTLEQWDIRWVMVALFCHYLLILVVVQLYSHVKILSFLELASSYYVIN